MNTADVGWYRHQTKAIGIITPSANLVVERVTAAILADFPEASAHYSRTPVFGSSDPVKDDYDWDGMLTAARLLAHANVDVICWNGSKGVSLGFDVDTTLCDRITAETGLPATTSITALEKVLKGLGVRTVGLVSPYEGYYQTRLVDAFNARGWPCIAEAHADLADNYSYCAIPDARIIEMIERVALAKPDVILTFCTNFPAAHLSAGNGNHDRHQNPGYHRAGGMGSLALGGI